MITAIGHAQQTTFTANPFDKASKSLHSKRFEFYENKFIEHTKISEKNYENHSYLGFAYHSMKGIANMLHMGYEKLAMCIYDYKISKDAVKSATK